MPHVEGIKLTTAKTTALQRRAGEEGVTIHAAISVALTIQGRAIDESWYNNPLRIMSPAEIRDILGLKDQCMVSFGGGEISIAPGGSMKFWEVARFAKDGLSAVKSTENISRMVDLQSTAISSNLSVVQALRLKGNAFNAQVMFSNLGRLPFDSTFGSLKLKPSGHHVHSVASKESRPLEQSPLTARCTSRTPAPRQSPAYSRA
jgi:hypothetical protein